MCRAVNVIFTSRRDDPLDGGENGCLVSLSPPRGGEAGGSNASAYLRSSTLRVATVTAADGDDIPAPGCSTGCGIPLNAA
jgi:hypothetical protein